MEPRPARRIAAIGIAQGVVYAGLAVAAAERWPVAATVIGIAAVAQGAGALLARDARAPRLAGAVSLALVGLLVGMHVQAAIHVIRAFAPAGAAMAWQALGVVLLALPWVAAVPVWQVGWSGRAFGAAAALLAVPVLATVTAGPDRTWPPIDGARVAAWALDRAQGGSEAPPAGSGPVKLVVTGVRGGVFARQVVEGDDLGAALASLDVRGAEAVIVEAAVAEGPVARPWLVGRPILRPGEDGYVADRLVGAREAWSIVAPVWIGPALAVPGVTGTPARQVRFAAWVAGPGGVVRLHQGWAEAPPLDAEAVGDAALEGARMLARNQRDGGRFAYVVKGPEGTYGAGYNYPRHAGATWFLALAARRDEALRPATAEALGFLRDATTTRGGMSWVLDPDRDDGRVWVGTTALALLALLEAEGSSDEAARYAAFVAASVDPEGRVRGDYDLASAAFPDQPEVPYAQGQALLALAVADRAGVPGVRDALERAAAWSDDGYRPGGLLFSLDDHWGCLAALAVDEALGRAAGLRACDTWLASTWDRPVDGSPWQPAAGPAGAIAEAWVARAALAQRTGDRGPWGDVARSYGRLFLAQQYRAADAPLLGRPDRLIGGFRDRPWALDVRVDSVQHVGCALLGLEALLRADRGGQVAPQLGEVPVR